MNSPAIATDMFVQPPLVGNPVAGSRMALSIAVNALTSAGLSGFLSSAGKPDQKPFTARAHCSPTSHGFFQKAIASFRLAAGTFCNLASMCRAPIAIALDCRPYLRSMCRLRAAPLAALMKRLLLCSMTPVSVTTRRRAVDHCA